MTAGDRRLDAAPPTVPDPTDPRRFLHAPEGGAELAAWNEVGAQHAERGRLPRISEIAEAGHEQPLAACAVAAYATFHELWSTVAPWSEREHAEPDDVTERLNLLREADAVAAFHGAAEGGAS